MRHGGVSDGVLNQNSGTFPHVESGSHVVDRFVEDHQQGVYEVVEVERLPTSSQRRNDERQVGVRHTSGRQVPNLGLPFVLATAAG